MIYILFAAGVVGGLGLALAGIYARREKRADERTRTAYIRGFDACSRIRDREETQERKLRLLVGADDRVSVVRKDSAKESTHQIVVEDDTADVVPHIYNWHKPSN